MKATLRAKKVYTALKKAYPNAHCSLSFDNTWELFVATILSAQCTDKRVNLVTPHLFKQFPTIESFAQGKIEHIEAAVRSTGFYRNKAKAIQGSARMIMNVFDGQVPDTMSALLKLPGVARKTANVVLGVAFHKAEGVVVDTHVARLSMRLHLSNEKRPEKIERDLMKRFPREQWINISHLFIDHGRAVCKARNPACDQCPLNVICPSAFQI